MKTQEDYVRFKESLLPEIGNICQLVRWRNGYSASAIAKQLNVDRTLIHKFEHGQVNSLTIFYCYYKLMNDEERAMIYEIE